MSVPGGTDRGSSDGPSRGSLWNPYFDRVLEQEPPLGAEELRLAIVVARLVFGYNETERRLGTDLVRRESKLHGRSLDRARNRLVARGLLHVEPGSPGRGHRTLWRPLRHDPDESRAENCPPETFAQNPAETTAQISARERGRIQETGELASASTFTPFGVEHLGLTPNQLFEVSQADPQLVSSWLASSAGAAVRNPAAVFLAGIRSGVPPRRDQSRYPLARAYVDEHGWPTGTRWARGSHAGSYVKDALGHDRAPYPVPWSRPTLAEVELALASRLDDDDAGPPRSS